MPVSNEAVNELLKRYGELPNQMQDMTLPVNRYLGNERNAINDLSRAGDILNRPDSKLQRGVDTALKLGAVIAAIADKTSGNKARRRSVGSKVSLFRQKMDATKAKRTAEKEKAYNRRLREIANRRDFNRNQLNATQMAVEANNRKIGAKMSATGKMYDATKSGQPNLEQKEKYSAMMLFKKSGMTEQEFAKQHPYEAKLLNMKSNYIPPEQYIADALSKLPTADYDKAIVKAIADGEDDKVKRLMNAKSKLVSEYENMLYSTLERLGYGVKGNDNPNIGNMSQNILGNQQDVLKAIFSMMANQNSQKKSSPIVEFFKQAHAKNTRNRPKKVIGSTSADYRIGPSRYYDYGIKQ